jgi:hypothetical protein
VAEDVMQKLLSTVVASVVLVGAAIAACGNSPSHSGFGSSDNDGGGGDASFSSDGSLFGGDAANLGDGSGSMTPGGPTTCDPSCMAAGGQCTNNDTTCVIVENPGAVDTVMQGQLQTGGTADSAFAWMYPYDQTVFPRGLIPPTLQFGGSSPDAVYVHVTFPGMDYTGFYGPSAPGRLVFSPAVWSAITLAATAHASVQVDVTKTAGGQVAGPITEHWSIAQGSLRGTIYYETYDSQLAGGVGSVGIMQIQPGAAQPTVVKSGCGNVCHTASADGSTLVANTVLGFGSASYDLASKAATIYAAGSQIFTYGGIYPDGSFVVSATHYRTWTDAPSRLYLTSTGANIPTPSWDGTITNGGTVAFSPDGKHVAFNHEDVGGGHTLAAMDFDKPSNTFSNLRDIAGDSNNTLAWPAFTPDGNVVVYHDGSNEEFETDDGATGDLYATDLTTHSIHRLDALDGYSGTGTATYLPANDPGLSFAPTVLPEAVGGFYWVVFTSHRSYGNTLASMEGPSGSPDEYGKLWVAAIEIDPVSGTDSSHPAFYLDGQEANADNLRGFWVLSPCKQDGSACGSGDDCCGGFCRQGDAGGLQCVAPPGGCSNVYESCTTASDCCMSSNECINGRCALPPPR